VFLISISTCSCLFIGIDAYTTAPSYISHWHTVRARIYRDLSTEHSSHPTQNIYDLDDSSLRLSVLINSPRGFGFQSIYSIIQSMPEYSYDTLSKRTIASNDVNTSSMKRSADVLYYPNEPFNCTGREVLPEANRSVGGGWSSRTVHEVNWRMR